MHARHRDASVSMIGEHPVESSDRMFPNHPHK